MFFSAVFPLVYEVAIDTLPGDLQVLGMHVSGDMPRIARGVATLATGISDIGNELHVELH